jgi:hypothetical protein
MEQGIMRTRMLWKTLLLGFMASTIGLHAAMNAPAGYAARMAHVLQAKGISDTDLWVGVDPVSGAYQRVHLYAHSISDFGCSATLNTSKTGGLVAHFEGLFTESDKDGTLVMDTALRSTTRPGRYWVIAYCQYPISGSGKEPMAKYTLSFVLSHKPAPVVTPPPNLRAWVSPAAGSYQARMTLYAKTDPGVLCSSYFIESDVWIPGQAVRAGKMGIVTWHWTFQNEGTAYVTCDNRAEYARAQVDY